MGDLIQPLNPRWTTLLEYERQEKANPSKPAKAASILSSETGLAELRALVTEKTAERSGMALSPADRDQIEHARLARELEKRFKTHGAVAQAGKEARTLTRLNRVTVKQSSLPLSGRDADRKLSTDGDPLKS